MVDEIGASRAEQREAGTAAGQSGELVDGAQGIVTSAASRPLFVVPPQSTHRCTASVDHHEGGCWLSVRVVVLHRSLILFVRIAVSSA